MANSLIVLMLSIGLFSGIASGIFGIGGGDYHCSGLDLPGQVFPACRYRNQFGYFITPYRLVCGIGLLPTW